MIHDYSEIPVFFDFETQSACELKEHGGRLYSECPSTRVLTLSCLIDSALHIWIPEGVAPRYKGDIYLPKQYDGLYDSLTLHQTPKLPAPIAEATANRVFAAHNCSHFDYHIWRNVVRECLPTRFADTLYLARLAGLPHGGLDAVAKKLLGESKDSAKKIVDKLFYAKWENGEPVYPTVLPGQIEPLIRYCAVDTLILAKLWDVFSDLSVETDAIQAHQNINDRGILCDLRLAERLITTGIEASRRAADEVEELTKGELYGDRIDRKGNLRSTQQVHAWLKKQGVTIAAEGKPTLRKDVVQTYLDNPILFLAEDAELQLTPANLKEFNEKTLPLVTKVLKARATACRITSAKAERMGKRASRDGRLYDLHTYCKAHTRRASSQGVQIHNLTRGNKKVKISELLAAHESSTWPIGASDSFDYLDGLHGQSVSVDDTLSSLVRSCLYAGRDNLLGIADYAAIEARGIAWIADETKLLNAFTSGEDVYCKFASILYGREIKANESNQPPERQVGKIVVLGCGYGMGVDKFALTAHLLGVDLRAAGTTAEKCVETYRAAYQRIAGSYSGVLPDGRAYRRGGIWHQLNSAALAAILDGGIQHAGKCKFVYTDRVLRVTLPSGGELRYFNCRVEDRIPSYARGDIAGKLHPTIVYEGDRGETTMYGGKWAENIVQAICRDLLYTALVRCDQYGIPLIAHVHDETVGEYPATHSRDYLKAQCILMSHPPEWAEGFPISVEGYLSKRYLKAPAKTAYQITATNGVIAHEKN